MAKQKNHEGPFDEIGYDPNINFEPIFTEFDDASAVWPLPLKWLIDSIEAGRALPHDDFREARGH